MRLYDNDAYREDFIGIVYNLLQDDMTNDRANQIIDAFDLAPAVEIVPPAPNDPLTLEQLREMDGEPVWVVQVNGELRPMWMLVDAEDESAAGRLYCAMFEDYGTEMVRAIQNGTKTVTRRVIKPQPYLVKQDENVSCWCGHFVSESGKVLVDKPPYRTGDILYVRETWNRLLGDWLYKADQKPGMKNPGKWRPSIHMPREAARIFLRVTNVRVERLQDITAEAAEKEGCNDYTSTACGFADVWDSTIKPADRDLYGWNANPWVWVIEFEQCEKPREEST